MTGKPKATPSLSPISSEDVERHRGQWVLLRRGKVVAASKSPKEVFDKREEKFDSVYHVPTEHQAAF